MPRTKFSKEEWDQSQQELDERLEAMGFGRPITPYKESAAGGGKHTTWEVDHGPDKPSGPTTCRSTRILQRRLTCSRRTSGGRGTILSVGCRHVRASVQEQGWD